MVDLGDRSLYGVEAVHAAARTLVVHDVEFLVEESVEADLPVLQPPVEVLKYLLVHVINSIFALLAETEEVLQLLLRLALGVKVDLQLLLQILPSLCVLGLLAHLSGLRVIELVVGAFRFLLLLAEHGRTVRIGLLLLLLLSIVEFLLRLLVLAHLLFKDVKVPKVGVLQGPLLDIKFLLLSAIPRLLLWRQDLLRLDRSQALPLSELLLQVGRGTETCRDLFLLCRLLLLLLRILRLPLGRCGCALLGAILVEVDTFGLNAWVLLLWRSRSLLVIRFHY